MLILPIKQLLLFQMTVQKYYLIGVLLGSLVIKFWI